MRESGLCLAPSSGIMRWANAWPSSTPHGSKEPMFQTALWNATMIVDGEKVVHQLGSRSDV